MATIEERVSRLEGGYEHLATKADLANLQTDMNRTIVQFGVFMTGLVGTAVTFLKQTA